MKLNFPNPSRSFDERDKRVRFWGYDRSIEVAFFVEAEALKRLCPDMGVAETGFLNAFDEARERIYEAAGKIYARCGRGKGGYVLSVSDF